MKFCIKCCQQLDDDDNYCPACGQKQPIPCATQYSAVPVQMENIQSPLPNPSPANICAAPAAAIQKKPSALPCFIWSLVLIFVVNPVGTPFAIVSAIYAAIANSESDLPENASRHIGVSKTLCIIITLVDAICLLALIVWAVFSLKYYAGSFRFNRFGVFS